MDTLLAWPTLVFYIPIGFGALLAVGAAFGLAGGGAGAEGHLDGDADPPADGDGEGGVDLPGDAGALLALGKLPIALRLMLLAFSFGGLGLILGPLIRAVTPGPSSVGAVLAVLVALVGSIVTSAAVARVFVRRVPLLESETIRRADLVGATGRLVLAASARAGVAQVRDRRGNLHQVTCRTERNDPALPAGTEVLLLEYDEGTKVFLVAPVPLALRGR